MDLPPIRLRTLRRLHLLAICMLALLWVGLAALAAWPYVSGHDAYRSLMRDALADGVDWDGLRAVNPDVQALFLVDGASMAYPVVTAPGDARGDLYASHDFWGSESPLGCPRLARGAADSSLTVVEGNAIAHSDKMFSALTGAVDRNASDRLELTWATPGLGVQRLAYIREIGGDELRSACSGALEAASVNDLRGLLGEMAHAGGLDPDAASTATKAVIMVARAGGRDGAGDRAFLFAG